MLLIAGGCGGWPIVRRAAAYPGRRSLVCWRGLARPRRPARSPRVPASPPCGRERCLNFHYPPTCVHPVQAPIPPLPPACACVYSSPSRRTPVGRPREPREPDTAEDAGGQTDHLGQAYRGGLRRNLFFHKPPSFMNSLNPLFFSTLKSLFGRRVRSWLRTNAGGAPNTCKSRG